VLGRPTTVWLPCGRAEHGPVTSDKALPPGWPSSSALVVLDFAALYIERGESGH